METLFVVEKSTESTNGGYVNTISTEKKSIVFGVEKTTKLRFLIKTDSKPELGASQGINLENYNQQITHFMDDEGNQRSSVWLHEKVEA
jgi:hypothetical protein